MTEEVAVVEETAATPETVATPEAVIEAAKEEKETQAERTFSQEELDKIVQKEKAKAESRAERRALKAYAEKLEAMSPQPTAKPASTNSDGKPTMSQFDNVEDYVEAVADWKLTQRDQANQRQQAEQSQKAIYDKTEKIYAQAEKIPGFDREAFDELTLTPSIAQAIIDSDIPAKVMAHLTMNPDEVDRISQLSPARQSAEIGKLEVKLSTAATVKASNAPPPIKPIGNRGGATNGDVARMSMEEYIAHRAKDKPRWMR